MYPDTIFRWHDMSEIVVPQPSNVIDDSPLIMMAFSSDKGTEELVEITKDDFDNMYGTMDFDKHGQSAIQAKNIVDNGGRLLAKRVVANDSTLANLILVANVSGSDGQAVIKWTAQSISGCKTFEEVKSAALDLFDADNGVFPLFIIANNGRGKSIKAIRLNPDYATSKTIGMTFYTFIVYEGSKITEQVTMSVDPTVVYNNKAYRLDVNSTAQVTGEVNELVYSAYLNKLAEITEIDANVLRNYDIIYGYTNRGAIIEGITIDNESIDIDSNLGVKMAEGDNGEFGDKPVGTEAWEQALVDFYSGNFTNEIYDINAHKVSAILDANYPLSVKGAIFDLVTFREDCVFLRDYGLGLTTFLEIREMYNQFTDQRNFFTADYATSYEIQDPISKKNIEVTMLYDMAGLLVNHFANNAFAPLAGTYNGFILPSAIKGTINFTPINTPSVNQKEAMDDIRVNYAIFQDSQTNECVVQSCYSSQTKYTQLSYISNVIAIQKVMRAIRTMCPRQSWSGSYCICRSSE